MYVPSPSELSARPVGESRKCSTGRACVLTERSRNRPVPSRVAPPGSAIVPAQPAMHFRFAWGGPGAAQRSAS